MGKNFYLNNYSKNGAKSGVYKKDQTIQPVENENVEYKKFTFEKLELKESNFYEKRVPKRRLAAIFLILTDCEKAKEIVKILSEKELFKIVNEIIGIDKISEEEIKAVEQNFGKLGKLSQNLHGGKDFALELLQSSFGSAKGGELFVKCVEEQSRLNFSFLDKYSPEEINRIIYGESDIVISMIIGFLNPKKAARILSLLPREVSISVIRKMSGKLEINSDVLNIVSQKLMEKAKKIDENGASLFHGKNKLLEILKYSDLEQSEKLLDSIGEDNPDLANELKEGIFTFNDIPFIGRKDFETALKNYPDKEIAYVLKGARDEIRITFFTCISKRRAELIEDEMKVLGAVRKQDIDDKRKTFITYLKNLDAKGVISIKPDKETYIS